MIRKLSTLILLLGIAFGAAVVLPSGAYAASAIDAQCQGVTDSTACSSNVTPANLVTTIVNTLLFVVGALSVIAIIVGGFLYTTSGGDSGAITKAKTTIMYAIIGLVVSFAAFAVVNFVMKIFIK